MYAARPLSDSGKLTGRSFRTWLTGRSLNTFTGLTFFATRSDYAFTGRTWRAGRANNGFTWLALFTIAKGRETFRNALF
jgi:membrane-associated PAP2 superfamily phosphatase